MESTCLISRPTYSSEVLDEARALCILPDSAHPAMTFLIIEAGLSHNAETWPTDKAGTATEGPGRSHRPEQFESTDKAREQEAA
ncbi:MAG: hypothetical protein AB9903_18615 [Vulcanimicrobiota bacterium]